jgi:hypothetical protein
MKYLHFLLLMVLFLACTPAVNVTDELPTDKLVATAQKDLSLFDGTFIPKGAKAYQLGNQLRIEFPEGYLYVGSQVDLAGNRTIVSTQSVTITCSCDEGTGGCSPWSQGDKWGCTADSSCTKCTGTRTEDPEQLKIGKIIVRGDVIHLNEPLEFIDPREVNNYPMAFSEMFDVPEIMNSLTDFLNGVIPEEDKKILENLEPNDPIPPNFAKVPLKFMGRIVIIYLSKTNSIAARLSQVTGASCDCSSGSGCILEKEWLPPPLGGPITYCDALGCTTCSLTIEE